MAAGAVLAIDQGTTNTKTILVDASGAILARGSAPVPIEHPRSGWVEQDAEAIWQSVLQAIKPCVAAGPPIAAVGISNQRESVLVWDRRTGRPVGPVVTWQCRRTTDACNALKAKGVEGEVIAATGLPLDPLFPAPKLNWLIGEALAGPGAPAADDLAAGTVDSWLIYRLTGGKVHATDQSNASRTQLFDLGSRRWSDSLATLFDVPVGVMPEVFPSSQRFGETSGVPGLPDGIPVASAIGDSHGALFGHGAFRPGDAKATFGTGSSIMATVPEFCIPREGVTTTIAWALGEETTYAFEGNILVSASILPWTANLIGLDGDVDALVKLAESVPDTGGVALVPALVGLGAPHWAPSARGLVCGLNFTTERKHLARAAVESIAHQVADVVAAITRQSPVPLARVFVDGGASRSEFIMGLVADLIGQPVLQRDAPDVSALGAAYLAGLTVGVWDSLETIAALPRTTRQIAPTITAEARAQKIALWSEALLRCLVSPDAKHEEG